MERQHTVAVDDKLWAMLKTVCAVNGFTIKRQLNEVIENFVAKNMSTAMKGIVRVNKKSGR
jgi:very-short-patch-repair endonuclease